MRTKGTIPCARSGLGETADISRPSPVDAKQASKRVRYISIYPGINAPDEGTFTRAATIAKNIVTCTIDNAASTATFDETYGKILRPAIRSRRKIATSFTISRHAFIEPTQVTLAAMSNGSAGIARPVSSRGKSL